jgi:TRAP-type C4-dicarboxylate transport system permease small subunit
VTDSARGAAPSPAAPLGPGLRRFTAILGAFATLALWISGAGLVCMTAAIGWQVFGRFVLNNSPTWTEPVSLLLMLYYILLAAAVGVHERFHLSLDLFRSLVTERLRRAFDIANHLVVGLFGLGMAWYGAALVRATWTNTIPVLDLPQGASYLPIPIAGGLIALFALEHLLVLLAGQPDFVDERARAQAALGE